MTSMAPNTNPELLQLSPRTLQRLEKYRAFARANRMTFNQLSKREKEVLTMIAKGRTNEEIAAAMFRSVHTVRTHRNNLWRQLGIHNVVEAVYWAQAFDLV